MTHRALLLANVGIVVVLIVLTSLVAEDVPFVALLGAVIVVALLLSRGFAVLHRRLDARG